MSDEAPVTPGLATLAQRVDELEALLNRALSDLQDLATVGAGGCTTPHDTEPGASIQDAAEPVYSSLSAWVDGYFRVIFARSIGGEIRWCNQWQEHPEALTRLEALWRSWEALRLDTALGVATWLTSYLDPQLATLFGRSGTFTQCTPARHVACSQLGD